MSIQLAPSDSKLIQQALRELEKTDQTSTCLKQALAPSDSELIQQALRELKNIDQTSICLKKASKKITLNSLPVELINREVSKYLTHNEFTARACSKIIRMKLDEQSDFLKIKDKTKIEADKFKKNNNCLKDLLRQKGPIKYFTVTMLVETNILDINRKIGPRNKQRPILEYAMKHSDYNMVKLLIKHGVNLNNTARNNKTTMLELGERSNRTEIKHLIAIANADDKNLPLTKEQETFFKDNETDVVRILKVRREYLAKKEPLDPTSLRRKIQQALIESV